MRAIYLSMLIAVIAGTCVASPPGRPAIGATASTLTVRKSGSTTVPREIVDPVPTGRVDSFGKPIAGKLQITRIGAEGDERFPAAGSVA